MSQQLKCTNCNATYFDVLGDGMRYFHSCPPTAVDLVTGKTTESPTKRDENIVLKADGSSAGIKAAGKGIAVLQGAVTLPVIGDVIQP